MVSTRLLILFVVMLAISPIGLVSAKIILNRPDNLIHNYLVPTKQRIIKSDKPEAPTESKVVHSQRIFKSKIINLQFSYPAESRYVEVDFARLIDRSSKNSGQLLTINDRKSQSPSFIAMVEGTELAELQLGDTLIGTLDSANSFRLSSLDEKTAVSRELSPGIYYYVGRPKLDCGDKIVAYLVVKSPLQSKYKYLLFNLGQTELPRQADGIIPCEQADALVTSRIDDLINRKVPPIEDQLLKALDIVKNLTNKSASVAN